MEKFTPEYDSNPPLDLSLRNFEQMWGEKSGFTSEELERIWDDSADWYTDWPYHNFLHARETLWETMRLVDWCEAHRISINRRVLIIAALFHDAGYHMDHTKEGLDSKEAYSAEILGRQADNYGIQNEELSLAQQAIMATKLEAPISSVYDKILVRADLANVAQDYASSFLYKTKLFHKESEQQKGKDIDLWEFKVMSLRILATYLIHDLNLAVMGQSSDIDDEFMNSVITNFRRLVRELTVERSISEAELVTYINSVAFTRLIGFRSNPTAD